MQMSHDKLATTNILTMTYRLAKPIKPQQLVLVMRHWLAGLQSFFAVPECQ
jgi:hypothetical protein